MATGRPGKLTPEVQKRLTDAIAAGNYRQPACDYAGIDRRTFTNWLRKGKRAKRGLYRDFYQAVIEAEARCEVRLVAAWNQCMPENPSEYRHFLARRYPQRWSDKNRLELTGKGGQALEPVIQIVEVINPGAGAHQENGRPPAVELATPRPMPGLDE
jgi:hypothetical protein